MGYFESKIKYIIIQKAELNICFPLYKENIKVAYKFEIIQNLKEDMSDIGMAQYILDIPLPDTECQSSAQILSVPQLGRWKPIQLQVCGTSSFLSQAEDGKKRKKN